MIRISGGGRGGRWLPVGFNDKRLRVLGIWRGSYLVVNGPGRVPYRNRWKGDLGMCQCLMLLLM